MIRVGFQTNDGQEIIGGEFIGAPDANACMDQLIADNANRDDIVTYYLELVIGDDVHRYGYIDP